MTSGSKLTLQLLPAGYSVFVFFFIATLLPLVVIECCTSCLANVESLQKRMI